TSRAMRRSFFTAEGDLGVRATVPEADYGAVKGLLPGRIQTELLEARQEADLPLPHAGGEVADVGHTVAHGRQRVVGRVDVRDLVPAEGRRHARVGGWPHRVGARDRAVARILAEVDEDARAVGHLPRRRRD